jgi:hypothetical protein
MGATDGNRVGVRDRRGIRSAGAISVTVAEAHAIPHGVADTDAHTHAFPVAITNPVAVPDTGGDQFNGIVGRHDRQSRQQFPGTVFHQRI